MIVNDVKLPVETSNITPTQFTIKASRKAFDILSRGIYSQPITAIIREISANAADAMIAAGKKGTPFKVHLPNTFEPYFSVRDDGTGMSDEQVRTLYTTYFESDKTNTNELTGALGLGSKSPFSYTDQFTVESRHKGMKRMYSAFINQDGWPAIAKMAEAPTDECDGVEVRLAVQTKDFGEFQRLASEVLRWFDPLPVVVGAHNFVLQKQEYLTKTDSYGLHKEAAYGVSKSHIVMGNIAYRLESNKVRTAAIALSLTEKKVLDHGLDIFVKIGDVEITASREEVSYDEKTIAAIKSRITDAIADICKEIGQKISESPTIWQARRAVHDTKHSILGSVRDIGSIKWHDQNIVDHVRIPLTVNLELQELSFKTPRKGRTKIRDSKIDSVRADGRKIYINDCPGAFLRVKNDMEVRGVTSAYLLALDDNARRRGEQLPYNFLKDSGIDEVMIRTSTLSRAPKKTSGVRIPRRKGMLAKLNEWKPASSNQATDYWQPASVDLKQGGVYVEILYYHYFPFADSVAAQTKYHPSNLASILDSLKKLGHDIKVYGIRPGDSKMLTKYGNWLSLEEFIKKMAKETCTNELNHQLILSRTTAAEHDNLQRFYKKSFSEDSFFGKVVALDKAVFTAKNDEKVNSLTYLAKKGYWKLKGDEKEEDALRLMEEKMKDIYPLYAHIEWDYQAKSVAAFCQYVSLVDSEIKVKGLPKPMTPAEFAKSLLPASSCYLTLQEYDDLKWYVKADLGSKEQVYEAGNDEKSAENVMLLIEKELHSNNVDVYDDEELWEASRAAA